MKTKLIIEKQAEQNKELFDLYVNRLLHAFTKDRIEKLLSDYTSELTQFQEEAKEISADSPTVTVQKEPRFY